MRSRNGAIALSMRSLLFLERAQRTGRRLDGFARAGQRLLAAHPDSAAAARFAHRRNGITASSSVRRATLLVGAPICWSIMRTEVVDLGDLGRDLALAEHGVLRFALGLLRAHALLRQRGLGST
jgi:hypothetical protein